MFKKYRAVLIGVILMSYSICGNAGDYSDCGMESVEHPATNLQDEVVLNSIFIHSAWNTSWSSDEPEPPVAYLEATDGYQVDLVAQDIGFFSYCSFFLLSPQEDLEPGTEYQMLGEDGIPGETYLTSDVVDDEEPLLEVTPSADDGMVAILDMDDDVVLVAYKLPIELGQYWVAADGEGLTEVDLSAHGSQLTGGSTVDITAYDRAGNTTVVTYTLPPGSGSDAVDPVSCSASPVSRHPVGIVGLLISLLQGRAC